MKAMIEGTWRDRLSNEFNKGYFRSLADFVHNEYANHTIYPAESDIFSAFNHTPFEAVKVVILGQDPYHEPNQANGLCFSVKEGIKFPPSLQNIFKELKGDLGLDIPENGSLERWARQGVLLINATLTVRAHSAGSHQKRGWEEFTDTVIHLLADERENIVFILWGAYAQKKGAFIDRDKHLVLLSPHPSPLSAHRGFFGNKHFSKCNKYLTDKGIEPINW